MNQENELMKEVEDKEMDKRTKAWKVAATDNFEDFPVLTLEDLELLTLGVYQVKLAKKYTKMHMKGDDDYKIFVNDDFPKIVRAKLESRFSSNKNHMLWIKYDEEEGIEAVKGHYCRCRQGARVVGMCAHVCSVLWYLGHHRHNNQGIIQRVTMSKPFTIRDARTELESEWASQKSVKSTQEWVKLGWEGVWLGFLYSFLWFQVKWWIRNCRR